MPPLVWDQMVLQSSSLVSLCVLLLFCFSPQWLSFCSFSLEPASLSPSTYTCLLMQLIQISTRFVMYISCSITEPSIFNGTRSLSLFTLTRHCLFSLSSAVVHSHSTGQTRTLCAYFLSFLSSLHFFSGFTLSTPVTSMFTLAIF